MTLAQGDYHDAIECLQSASDWYINRCLAGSKSTSADGRGRSSGVEHHVANVRVVSSNLIARSKTSRKLVSIDLSPDVGKLRRFESALGRMLASLSPAASDQADIRSRISLARPRNAWPAAPGYLAAKDRGWL